jgi:hypothetical protein
LCRLLGYNLLCGGCGVFAGRFLLSHPTLPFTCTTNRKQISSWYLCRPESEAPYSSHVPVYGHSHEYY